MRKHLAYIVIAAALSLLSGCAYYNTFYNAEKFYKDAAKERKKRERTQVVELSPEEKLRLKRQGDLSEGSAADRPSSQEMQNYQRAIEKASSVLEYYPQSRWIDDALMMVGECFFYRREYTKAQRKFEEIINLYPNSHFVPQAHLLLGKTFLGLREFDAAEKKFREIALDRDFPNNVRQTAEYELGSLYFEKDNFESAAEEYARTAKESDDRLIRAMSWYRLGECQIQLKQYDQAPAIFRRAIQASPNEDFKSQATYKLGESQSLLKDYEAAIRTFSVLLAKELEVKRIPMIKLQLANNYRLQGNQEAAIKWYRNIIEEHKGTDASARSYYSMAEIEEYSKVDYAKAKEYYDLVRGEQSTSLIATTAKERSDNIKLMLELQQSINELLGIATAKDTLNGDNANGKKNRTDVDDAPIDLGSDGMWVNYAGRGRRPPQAGAGEDPADSVEGVNGAASVAGNDSTRRVAAEPDSVRQAREKAAAEKKKTVSLAEKRLALAELLMFSFDEPDSSLQLFLQVVESKPDSVMTARALYSIGYIMYAIKKDTVHADSLFRGLVYLYPNSPHAEGARRILHWPLLSDKVDSAGIAYREAEKAYWEEKDQRKALRLYKTIAKTFPKSPYAIKAEYGQGWLYEHDLHDYDKAIETYKSIVEKYPDSAYGKDLKNKLTRHDQAIQAIEARKKAIADSIKLASEKSSQAPSDSLKPAAAQDSSVVATAATDSSAVTVAAPLDSAAVMAPAAVQSQADPGEEKERLREAAMEAEREKRSRPAAPDSANQSPADPAMKKKKEAPRPKVQE